MELGIEDAVLNDHGEAWRGLRVTLAAESTVLR